MRHIAFAIVAAIGVGASLLPWIAPADRALLDGEFRFLRAHAARPVQRDVAIVGIDDQTTRRLPEPFALWHPHLGRFLAAMTEAGAAAVGIDLILPDRSFEAIVPGYDRQLLAGIVVARRSMPVVLALTVDPSGATRPIYPAFVAAAGQEGTGYALLPLDDDGVVRRFDARIGVGGSEVPTFAGRIAASLGRPVGPGLIDYASGGRFDYTALSTVLGWHAAGDAQRLRQAFEGRIVLLGGVLPFEDRLPVPVSLVAGEADAPSVPGVVLNAQVLRNLLNDGLIQPVPAWTVFALCLVAVSAWFLATNPALAAALWVAGVAIVIATSTWLLTRGTYLPQAAVLTALTGAIGARVVYEASVRLRERRRLRQAFAPYVSPRILQDILDSDPQPGLGGERYRLCVMFADIRGFTARAETVAPEAVIDLLNRYFAEVTDCVHGAGGTLDKFMGDGVMAFFGAPRRLDNPCVPAFRAARELLARVARLDQALAAEGEAPIAIGIGLHVGDAVVGNVGSAARHNYTAIGDVVNVASRLESLTKEVDFPLVCSAAVFDRLDDRAGFVKLGTKSVKGRRAVEVYGWRPAETAAPIREVTGT